MKNSPKRPISPISLFICLKSKKIFHTASLFALVLGIFLLPKTAQMAAITPDKVLELTNNERAKAGLNELQTNNQLTKAAASKAAAIITYQVFDHTIYNRRFSAWARESGYEYKIIGENLAIDFITSEGLVKAWMASTEHRENILDKSYLDTGIAVAEGRFEGQNTIVVVQIFGDPLAKTPPIPPAIARLEEKIQPLKKPMAKNLSFHGLLGNVSLLAVRRAYLF